MFPAAIAILVCVTALAADVAKREAVLDRGRDPERIEAAAVALVSSEDPAAIAALAKRFSNAAFLRRLDPPRNNVSSVIHLGVVFRALAEHPSPATARLCLALAANSVFTSEPARMNFLLNALGAVRPVSPEAAAVFRFTGMSGYAEVNGPVLARNGSPAALEVLSELLAADSLTPPERISIAHWSILPVRTDSNVVAACAKELKNPSLNGDVRIAILESLFDYQPRAWFGLRVGQPSPPPWPSASPAARSILAAIGAEALKRGDLPPGLRAAIQNTLSALQAVAHPPGRPGPVSSCHLPG